MTSMESVDRDNDQWVTCLRPTLRGNHSLHGAYLLWVILLILILGQDKQYRTTRLSENKTDNYYLISFMSIHNIYWILFTEPKISQILLVNPDLPVFVIITGSQCSDAKRAPELLVFSWQSPSSDCRRHCSFLSSSSIDS